jgi:hypothetical protein
MRSVIRDRSLEIRWSCALWALAAVGAFLAQPCWGAVTIHDETESRCWFSGSEVSAVFRVSGLESQQATGRWRLSAANHTVARGETALVTENGSAPFRITFALPELNAGVAAELLLELSATDARSGNELGMTNSTIHSFSPEAFASREKWFDALDITLFDSEKATSHLFDDMGIPCRFLRNADALVEVSKGLLIVGEGVSLKESRGLWDALLGVASRGVPVLCLALREGDFTLPGVGPTELAAKPSAMTMKRHQAVSDVDKRFDQKSWCGKRNVASHSIVFEGERGPVAARVQEGSDGWLWLEQSYEDVASRLVLCQFRLVKHWEQSPVPRYFLLKVLETMCPAEADKQEEE